MGLLLPEFLENSSPILQGLFGTFFTWFVTAVGAAVVFMIPRNLSEKSEVKFLDASLGFAAGVMLAASYWSLLAPAIELSEEDGYGSFSFIPALIGFLGGCVFVSVADLLLPEPSHQPPISFGEEEKWEEEDEKWEDDNRDEESKGWGNWNDFNSGGVRHRREKDRGRVLEEKRRKKEKKKKDSWRRLLLLVVAVTIHNFPEGLAVGVGYGGVGSTAGATLEKADLLAVGIGIQNFPEGLAVSLPMRRLGFSPFTCFFYGQLSGMVEPIGGLLGAWAVSIARPCLPYALAFAAGAMVYVVVDSLVPEVKNRGWGTWGSMVGFVVMMTLDVGLG